MNESIFDRRLDEQLCFRLYRASSGMSKMYSQVLHAYGLTFSQYLVLLALWDEQGVPINDIGQRTGMGIGTLNPMLTRMEANGWLYKQHHQTDKRTMLVFLTEKADATKPSINQSILNQLKDCNFQGMDLMALMNQLELLQKQMDAITSKP